MKIQDAKEYALGTNDAEIVRLGMQHHMWSESAYAVWERAGIRSGHTVLDIGCGPGYTSFALAGLVAPQGKIIAVDESARFIEHLRQRQHLAGTTSIEARVGDVQQLDIEQSSIDVAYQRWVLCFVKDPDAVVRGVARSLKPGGKFVIQEYMNYEGILLAPESAAFRRFVSIVAAEWNRHGGDTTIGLKLPALLEKSGLKVEEIRPLHRVARPGSTLWTWPTIFINTYGPKLVEEGRMTVAEHNALVRDWQEHERTPGAFFCSPPMVEIIAVKS